ncbi:MAG: ATP-binding protein [Candidatus Pacearchaeota archaeon]|nr:ATP-binding protein [Candidatus Pacearchaeota archaeon]
MEFKDRKNELKEIKSILDSKNFEFLIIYGRRRIGKTELILESTKNKKRIYYLATTEKNAERFYNVCLEYSKDVGKLKQDIEIIIDYLKDKTEVIIIDEFQNLIKENGNILNIFQSLIDTKLKHTKLKLILLGSSVSIITSKVLSYKSPLYGRRTASFKLKPINFFDLKEFFPNKSLQELIEIYGFSDGIPYYIIKINEKENFWKWFENEIKQERSFLRDEIDFIMRYEFDNPSTYKIILEAIANGKSKLNEIRQYTKLERTDISPYIKNLLDVDLIKREVPLTENLKSRNGRYFISDNFLSFWFRFIYPNSSSIESGLFKIERIKEKYAEYIGKIFEKVVLQYIIKNKIIEADKIGRWWFKDKEIDLIALNEKNKEATFIECKWKEGINPISLLHDLKEKAIHFEWHNNKRKEKYFLFAKSFSKEIEDKDVTLIEIKDMQ